MKPKTLVLDTQRMSTEDGPGIRTTVFFKGCSLACSWCHNPESISSAPHMEWYSVRCIGCMSCAAACPNGALAFVKSGLLFRREHCIACGQCAEHCPTRAIELKGRVWSEDELFSYLLKDKAYFEKSGGGITFSGGEPLLHAAYLAPLLTRLREAGIHTAIDTAGNVPKRTLLDLLPLTDLVLYDLKIWDDKQHKNYTKAGNTRILENAQELAAYIRAAGSPTLWIRTPIIPGATDSKENIEGIGRFIKKEMAGVVERWELCAFNNLCRDKYERMDTEWCFSDVALSSKETLSSLTKIAQQYVPNHVAMWSGSVME